MIFFSLTYLVLISSYSAAANDPSQADAIAKELKNASEIVYVLGFDEKNHLLIISKNILTKGHEKEYLRGIRISSSNGGEPVFLKGIEGKNHYAFLIPQQGIDILASFDNIQAVTKNGNHSIFRIKKK